MIIQTVRAFTMQTAGTELPVDVGVRLDLPAPTALALVASGAAVEVPEPMPVREVAALEVPASRGRRKREVAA